MQYEQYRMISPWSSTEPEPITVSQFARMHALGDGCCLCF